MAPVAAGLGAGGQALLGSEEGAELWVSSGSGAGLGADSDCSSVAPSGRHVLGTRLGTTPDSCSLWSEAPASGCAPGPSPQGPQPPPMVSVTCLHPGSQLEPPWTGSGRCNLPTCLQEAVVFRRSFCLSPSHRKRTPLISLLPPA